MYKKLKATKTSLKVNTSYEGESIEKKVHRIVNNKEPIKDGAPLIYTDRADGVKPEYDIRTDRWELAVDAMDKVQADKITKRKERAEARKEKSEPKTDNKPIGGTEPIQGTGDQNTPN